MTGWAQVGKKGEWHVKMRELRRLTPEDRQGAGPALNALKDEINAALAAKKAGLADAALDARLRDEWLDVTLPARPRRRHPLHGAPTPRHPSRCPPRCPPHGGPRPPPPTPLCAPLECTLRTRNLATLGVWVACAALVPTRARWGGTSQGLSTPEPTLRSFEAV